MLVFKKRLIANEKFEACSVFDVNNDGIPDIVSGSYWYEGPDFTVRHLICEVAPIGEYHDDLCDYPLDVDGDGWTDIITASWWSNLRWRKNPGMDGGEWQTFDSGPLSCTETLRFFDIDGCGVPEVFPNEYDQPQAFFKLTRQIGNGRPEFRKTVIGGEARSHGMGLADINGDGRMDIVISSGWYEQPEDPYTVPWKFHAEFDLGREASIPILGIDVNGDGLCDLIYGNAHDYGLFWLEQKQDAGGARTWVRREIDMTGSQFHDMQLIDLDNDGQLELITGKRYRAHNDHDPGAFDPVGLYYYKINGGHFDKYVIDFGPAGEASGTGMYFWVQYITGNGFPDIVAPGKDGLYFFENRGLGGEEAS